MTKIKTKLLRLFTKLNTWSISEINLLINMGDEVCRSWCLSLIFGLPLIFLVVLTSLITRLSNYFISLLSENLGG